MKKQVSNFNVGDIVSWMEDGWNHVVGKVIGKDSEGVSIWATSLTFGSECCDGVFLPNDYPVTKFQSPVPQILND